MGIQVTTVSGDVFTIPERGDPNWGKNLTEYLVSLKDALKAGESIIAAELVIKPTQVTVNDGDQLDVTGASTVLLTTTGSDVMLDETTPIVIPTERDGKILKLINIDEVNSVTIPDTGIVDINGAVELFYLHSLELQWIEAVGRWIEISRNN